MRKLLIGAGVLLVLAVLGSMSGSLGRAASLDADTTPPALQLPADMTVEATGPSGAVVSFTATATDLVDGPVPVTCAPASGATFPLGVTTPVSCSATDAAGNTGTGSFAVTVAHTAPPALHLPASVTAEATGASGAAVSFTATATDLVDGDVPVTCTPTSGSTFALGTATVSCSAADAAGHTATGGFSVTVSDTRPPALTLPADMTVTATGASGATATFTATATDLVDGAVVVACTPASGSVFPVGATSVSCSAADARGNRASGAFTVTVRNTSPPTLHLPADLTVEATGASGAAATFVATATDLVGAAVPVTCAPASGSTFALGTATVSCSATDTAGNSASGSFRVTVSDTRAPALQLPASTSASATGPSGAAVSFTASATDVVDGDVAVTCAPASGATFPLGATSVSCSAIDAHGNRASGTFTVTVSDTKPPTLTLPADLKVEANGPGGSKVAYTDVSATDAVDGGIAPGSITCDPASGSLFALGTATVSCSVADAAGNRTSGTFSVTVADTTPPVLAVPPDATVYATTAAGIPATADAVARLLDAAHAVDLVDPHPKVEDDAPAVFARGTTTVTFTATDAAKNVVTKTFRVTVIDRPASGGGGGGGGGSTVLPAAPAPKAIDTAPPANPGRVVAKSGPGYVQLTWTLPTDSDFDHVEIFRSGERTTAARVETRVYSGRGTSFTDRGLPAGTRYRYVLASFDTAGNRSAGAVALAAAKAVMLLAPASGARVSRVPVLRWKALAGTAYYNVQLYLGAKKVLSAWPISTSLRLALAWRYAGKRYTLTPGQYRWYVWPGVGPRSAGKYGALLGDSTFTVLKGVKK